MTMRTLRISLMIVCAAAVLFAQAKNPPVKKTAASSSRTPADLSQLMKGILYPSSNVIFAAQSQNPDEVKPAADPAMSVNPLASTYGKWQAVENSSLAIAEAASLLTIPGRKCSNGLPAPLAKPDWAQLVQGLREAGLATYKAAQSKNQDQIVEAAGNLTMACDNCHEKYREKPSPADRCK